MKLSLFTGLLKNPSLIRTGRPQNHRALFKKSKKNILAGGREEKAKKGIKK
jgi:hypothetical protein